MYCVQHCFIYRPSDSTVLDRTQDCCDYDIGIDTLTTRLDLIHTRLDLIHQEKFWLITEKNTF